MVLFHPRYRQFVYASCFIVEDELQMREESALDTGTVVKIERRKQMFITFLLRERAIVLIRKTEASGGKLSCHT